MNSKNCPNCKKDIGILSIFKAGLPSRIKCPYCNSSLIYKPSAWRVVLVSLIFIVPIIIAIFYFVFEQLSLSKPIELLISFGVSFVVWEVFEVYFALRLRKSYELVLKE